MDKIFDREKKLIGEENFKRLEASHVAVFGVGGVGSYVIEGLVRAGIGKITIVDYDIIESSNLNRQVHTNIYNINNLKVDEMGIRIRAINPNVEIIMINKIYKEDTHNEIFNDNWDYIVDAIDMVYSKILLIKKASESEIKIISSMGTANKIDPLKFSINNIKHTKMCPLARVIRKKVKDFKTDNLKVLFSTEKPNNYLHDNDIKGTISFIPSIAGLMIAAEVVRDIIDLGYLHEK